MIKKRDYVNVQGHNKIMVILDKFTKNKICVDLIGPYNTQEGKARNNV